MSSQSEIQLEDGKKSFPLYPGNSSKRRAYLILCLPSISYFPPKLRSAAFLLTGKLLVGIEPTTVAAIVRNRAAPKRQVIFVYEYMYVMLRIKFVIINAMEFDSHLEE